MILFYRIFIKLIGVTLINTIVWVSTIHYLNIVFINPSQTAFHNHLFTLAIYIKIDIDVGMDRQIERYSYKMFHIEIVQF